jgi:hypothetical protein
MLYNNKPTSSENNEKDIKKEKEQSMSREC